jgi:hypothetical protein
MQNWLPHSQFPFLGLFISTDVEQILTARRAASLREGVAAPA